MSGFFVHCCFWHSSKLLSEVTFSHFSCYSNICVDISQIIYPSATGHLDGFHFGSILNRAAIIFLLMSCQDMQSRIHWPEIRFSLDFYLRVAMAGLPDMYMFSVSRYGHAATNGVWEFSLLYVLANTGILGLFRFHRSNRTVVVSHCSFTLHFSEN